ncbi:hypothetical protein C0993_005031, partial [Termitomyces sp. T159_Od127]
RRMQGGCIDPVPNFHNLIRKLRVVDSMEFPSQLVLWGPAAAPVILVEGLSTRECQEQRVQKVKVGKGEVACTTSPDGCTLSRTGPALFLDLSCAGRAPPGTPAHCYFAPGPVYLRVVLPEPSEAKDHVLLA